MRPKVSSAVRGADHWSKIHCSLCSRLQCQWRQREFKIGGTKCQRGWDVRGEGVPPPQNIFCFVISKWHVLVYSEVLDLKFVIILGEMFPLTSPKPKYWRGCAPGIPGGADASGKFVSSSCRRKAE